MSEFAKVRSCDELAAHTHIEARRDGMVHLAGRVSEAMPEIGLFWAVSDFGERRIIILDEYEVYMIDPHHVTALTGSPDVTDARGASQ